MRTLLETLKVNGKINKDSELYVRLKNDFTFHSSAIEGSKVTMEHNMELITAPTQQTKSKLLQLYPEKDVLENENLINVFDLVIDTYETSLSVEYIKKMHKMLCFNSPDLIDRNEKAGEFRTSDVRVGNHIGARPAFIPALVEDLIKKNSAAMDLEKIAIFHAEYEIIHPFYDGNGRTGRMIMLKQCLEHNVKPFFVEEFSKNQYYQGLEYYTATNSAKSLINYFSQQQRRFENLYLEDNK
jgi:Fic family protein